MSLPVTTFSDDQAEAFDRIAEVLRSAGVDIEESMITPRADTGQGVVAVIGKAGSGKTMLLARLAEALSEAGVETISGDYEGRRRKDKRTLAMVREMDAQGFGNCTNQYECEAVCPKSISADVIAKLNRDYTAAQAREAVTTG